MSTDLLRSILFLLRESFTCLLPELKLKLEPPRILLDPPSFLMNLRKIGPYLHSLVKSIYIFRKNEQLTRVGKHADKIALPISIIFHASPYAKSSK